MKELWGYIKGFFITIGLIITILIVISIFESAPPDWSGSPIDDLLYYAYDYEKFGLFALIWRLFIIYTVVVQSWVLLKALWKKIKTKLPLETTIAAQNNSQQQESST